MFHLKPQPTPTPRIGLRGLEIWLHKITPPKPRQTNPESDLIDFVWTSDLAPELDHLVENFAETSVGNW